MPTLRLHPNKLGSVCGPFQCGPYVSVADAVTCEVGVAIACRVLTSRESYGHLELPTGRTAKLTPGDIIVGVLGDRAALRGFCGAVPPSAEVGGTLHLLNQGGVIGLSGADHPTMGHPIALEVLGTVVRDGVPLRLRDYAIPTVPLPEKTPPVLAVVGTCMSAGKTTAAASVIRYLSFQGTVHAGKATGVGCLKDLAHFTDNGATRTLSFLECGLPSTCGRDDVALVAENILAHLSRGAPDWIVIELGDGLLGEYGVDAILDHAPFASRITACLLAANDLIGALAGAEALTRRGLKVHVVTGPVTDNVAAQRKLEAAGLRPINAFSHREALGAAVAEQLLASSVGPAIAAQPPSSTTGSEHLPSMVEAARWVEQFRDRIGIVKIADELLGDESSLERVLAQVAVLHRLGIRVGIVHGGGSHIDRALEARGMPGLNDAAPVISGRVLDVVVEVVAEGLNRTIVDGLRALGAPARGHGDGLTASVRGTRRAPDDALGTVDGVDAASVGDAPDWVIPVFPSLATASDGSLLAVPSDRLASQVAIGLGAVKLVLLTGVRGILHDPSDAGPISELTASAARALIAQGRVDGGMRRKLDEGLEALDGGVERVHVVSGRDPSTLLLEVLADEGCGTMIRPG